MSQSTKQFTIPILYSNLSSLHTPLPHHGRLSYGRSPRLLWHLGYIVGNKGSIVNWHQGRRVGQQNLPPLERRQKWQFRDALIMYAVRIVTDRHLQLLQREKNWIEKAYHCFYSLQWSEWTCLFDPCVHLHREKLTLPSPSLGYGTFMINKEWLEQQRPGFHFIQYT